MVLPTTVMLPVPLETPAHVLLVIVTYPAPPEVVFCGVDHDAGITNVTVELGEKSSALGLGAVNVKVKDCVAPAETLVGLATIVPAPSVAAANAMAGAAKRAREAMATVAARSLRECIGKYE